MAHEGIIQVFDDMKNHGLRETDHEYGQVAVIRIGEGHNNEGDQGEE